MSISAPQKPFETFSEERVKEALLNSEIVDWRKRYTFSGIDRDISQIFIDLSLKVMGNITLTLPDITYYMETESAAALELDLTPYKYVSTPTSDCSIDTGIDTSIDTYPDFSTILSIDTGHPVSIPDFALKYQD